MIVVDTSVVIDALAGSKSDDDLHFRLARAGRLHAPHLLDYEVLSTLRGMTRGGVVEPDRAQQILSDLQRTPVLRHALGPMSMDVWEWRHNMTAYDAAYVALARRLGVPLWTRDVKLARACDGVVEVVVP